MFQDHILNLSSNDQSKGALRREEIANASELLVYFRRAMSESLVAIVTGGAQGLGAAIAVLLLKRGYKVCVADIQEEKGTQFVKEQQEIYGSHHVIFAKCDVANEDDYQGIFDFTQREFNRIDLVVNNAGVVLEHNARKCVDINLMGPIIGCQLAVKYMGKSKGGNGGVVINTSSILGFLPYHALPVYTATKHGIIGLTRSFGLPYNLEKEGVIFSALCPSFTDTEMLKQISPNSLDADNDPIKGYTVMSPEYVARGVAKLLDDKINGSTLVVTNSNGYQYIGYQEQFKGFQIQ